MRSDTDCPSSPPLSEDESVLAKVKLMTDVFRQQMLVSYLNIIPFIQYELEPEEESLLRLLIFLNGFGSCNIITSSSSPAR